MADENERYVVALRRGHESLEKIVDAIRSLDDAVIPGDDGTYVYGGRAILVVYPGTKEELAEKLGHLASSVRIENYRESETKK